MKSINFQLFSQNLLQILRLSADTFYTKQTAEKSDYKENSEAAIGALIFVFLKTILVVSPEASVIFTCETVDWPFGKLNSICLMYFNN